MDVNRAKNIDRRRDKAMKRLQESPFSQGEGGGRNSDLTKNRG